MTTKEKSFVLLLRDHPPLARFFHEQLGFRMCPELIVALAAVFHSKLFRSNEKFRSSADFGTLRHYPAAICCGKARVTSRSYSFFVELTGVHFFRARLNRVSVFSSLPVSTIIAKTTSLVSECSASPGITAWCNASAALSAQVGIIFSKLVTVFKPLVCIQYGTLSHVHIKIYSPADFTQRLIGLRLYGEDTSFVSSR